MITWNIFYPANHVVLDSFFRTFRVAFLNALIFLKQQPYYQLQLSLSEQKAWSYMTPNILSETRSGIYH